MQYRLAPAEHYDEAVSALPEYRELEDPLNRILWALTQVLLGLLKSEMDGR